MSAMTLRDYQEQDVGLIIKELEESRSTLYVAATGLGKTLVMTELVKRMGVRAIMLAHRSELIFQARNAFLRAGIEVEIEKADLTASTSLFNRAPVVIATVQTMASGEALRKRMHRFKPEDFGILLYDECFPSGTKVDGKPIEKIKEGDFVTSFDGGLCCFREVKKTFKSKPKSLVVVRYGDGSQTVCTGGHPIWCAKTNKYKPASRLTTDDVVLRLITGYEYETQRDEKIKLRHMREGNTMEVFSTSETMWKPAVQKGAFVKYCGKHQPEIRIRKDEEKQSHAQEGGKRKGVGNPSSNRTQAGGSRGKRKTTYGARAEVGDGSWLVNREVGDGSWLVNRLPCSHWLLERGERDASTLHYRRGKPCYESGDRGGWIFPLCIGKEAARYKKGYFFEGVGVDSVKVLKPGCDGTFGGLCLDGYVYNLHVEEYNNYFADGILVHNCHHSVSVGNKAIVDYFLDGNPKLKVVGVTATPDRSDEEALGQIFETVASERDVLFGVDNGWLIEPEQQMVSVAGLDFSHMRTTAGDLNGADLSAAMEAESSIQGVVQPVLEAMFGCEPGFLFDVPSEQWCERLTEKGEPRRTIVFTVSVRQAEMLSNIFNRVVPNLSLWVCGKTSEQERQDIFKSFEDGRSHILVNCGVTTEGYDNPKVSIIAIARPTKSRSLYAQMIGRGTRPLPGVVDGGKDKVQRLEAIKTSPKPRMLAMDFVGNSGKHKLITTADILGGNVSDEAVVIAEMKAKKSKTPVNMKQLLEEEEKKLQEERELRRLAEEARKQKLVAKVKYSKTKIDPFNAFDITPGKPRGWDEHKQLSEKQRHLLMRQGVDPDTLGYTGGKAVLSELFRRWGSGLCTLKQANLLKGFGYETKELTMKQASSLIDQLAKNGWRKL